MKSKNKVAKFFAVLGIAVGIFAIVMGANIFGDSRAYIRKDMEFGGDYYTEIYGVTESIRGNTNSMYNAIQEGFGMLIIVFGLTDVCAFGYVLFSKSKVVATLESVEDRTQNY